MIVSRRILPRPRVWVLAGIASAVLAGPSAGQVARPAADEGTIDAEGFRLRYRIEGEGRPAIVIGSAVYYPRVFSRGLREHLRLVFLDHRGFATPPPGVVDKSAFGLDKIVDDVERARRELGLEKVAVIGHSGHAFMAMEYAKKYPAHVSHVILIGIAPDLSVAGAEAAERHWQESASPDRKAALGDNLRKLPDEVLEKLPPRDRFVKNYVRDGPRAWYDFRFDATPLWDGVDINVDVYDYLWGQVFRDIDITRGLASFDRPVFLALGRHDYAVAPPASWDRIKPKFASLTVHIFERSGHTPPLEQPALFDAAMLRWIAEHR